MSNHDIVLASSDGPLIQEAQALGIRWQPIDFYQGGLLPSTTLAALALDALPFLACAFFMAAPQEP